MNKQFLVFAMKTIFDIFLYIIKPVFTKY